MAGSIDPWVPKVAFLIKIHDFWAPFWHRFFDFFRKWQKCEISEEYNAKRGSEPSKTFDCRIGFSLIVNVFSEFPLGEHFWRITLPTYAQKYDFGTILDPRASKNTHLNNTFDPAGSKWCNPLIEGSTQIPTWSRLGAENAPRMHLDRFGIVV